MTHKCGAYQNTLGIWECSNDECVCPGSSPEMCEMDDGDDILNEQNSNYNRDIGEAIDRRMDDPRHGQAASINRDRYNRG